MKVKDFVIEQTGGYVYVAWGSFEDGTYFSISSDALFVYDADEYVAMDDDNYDGYTWEQQHIINSYDYTSNEYYYVLIQLWDKTKENERMIDLFYVIRKQTEEEEMKEDYILNYGINNGICNYDNNYTDWKQVVDDMLTAMDEDVVNNMKLLECVYDLDYWYNYLKSIEE